MVTLRSQSAAKLQYPVKKKACNNNKTLPKVKQKIKLQKLLHIITHIKWQLH